MSPAQRRAIETLARLKLVELEIAEEPYSRAVTIRQSAAEGARHERRMELGYLFPELSAIELTAVFRIRAHELFREKHGRPSRDEATMAREEGWERFTPQLALGHGEGGWIG